MVYIYLLSNQIYHFSDLDFLERKDTEVVMDNPGIHSRSCVESVSPCSMCITKGEIEWREDGLNTTNEQKEPLNLAAYTVQTEIQWFMAGRWDWRHVCTSYSSSGDSILSSQ